MNGHDNHVREPPGDVDEHTGGAEVDWLAVGILYIPCGFVLATAAQAVLYWQTGWAIWNLDLPGTS